MTTVPVTWDAVHTSSGITLSGGSLLATAAAGGANHKQVFANIGFLTGKVYWQIIPGTGIPTGMAGLGNVVSVLDGTNGLGNAPDSIVWYSTGGVYCGSSLIATWDTYTATSVLSFAVNAADGTTASVWGRVDSGSWNSSAGADPVAGIGGVLIPAAVRATFMVPAWDSSVGTGTATLRITAGSWSIAAPTGYGGITGPIVQPPYTGVAFYAVEAMINNPFDDPIGPADSGWLTTPVLALCAIEAAPTTSTVLRASDLGYRTRATDAGGVQVYPPSVVEAFHVDLSANLDPTKSAVAAAWGTLTFNNLDNKLDQIVSNWNSDGQTIRVLRGQKQLEAFLGFGTIRASSGTYISSSRVLATAAPAVVRQDWSSGAPIVLNEPAGINLSPTPLDFSGWTDTALTQSTDGTLAPDGTSTAQRFACTVAVAQHYSSFQSVGVANVSQTLSLYVKAFGAQRYAGLILYDQITPSNLIYAVFDLIAATVTFTGNQGTGSGAVGSITPVLANGWYRISLRGVPSAVANTIIARWGLSNAPSAAIPGYGGVTTDGLYAYGAQLETGALTSFMPSSRSADNLYPARQILVDPPYASLIPVFVGVMGPWRVTPTTVEVALRDASYYLERQVPRNLYGGTGGLDGEVGLAGQPKPKALGMKAGSPMPLKNVTPTLVDASNLIYQVTDDVLATGGGGVIPYDGGVPLTYSSSVPSLYSGSTIAGHFRICEALGLFQLGSIPVFGVTADVSPINSGSTFGEQDNTVGGLMLYLLGTLMAVPASMISATNAILTPLGSNPAASGRASKLSCALYLSSNDTIDGVTLVSRVLESSGALLVPGRDGALRMFLPAAIPVGSWPVLSLDDTTIVSIAAENLPSSIDPAPWRMRIAWDHNWTVETSLAGAVTPAQVTWLSQAFRTAYASAAPSALLLMARANDAPVIGADGGICDTGVSGADVKAVAADSIALWGTKRRLYSVTVPHFLSDGLDWGSVVKLKSSFDGLNAGKLGQIVGWAYASGDSTAVLKVLV
jgi:hypothetical protein